MNLTSVISTILAERNPEKIKKSSDHGWKVSLRNQSGILSLDNAVKTSVKGIGFRGGHEKAAGTYTTDWKTFEKRLRDNLKRHRAGAGVMIIILLIFLGLTVYYFRNRHEVQPP